MKLRLIITLFLATALGTICAEPPPAYPTITVDDAHSKLKHADGSTGAFYEMAPVSGVILDASHYQFDIPSQLKVDAPNSVQVIIGKDRQYSADWKPVDGKLTLDASTLKPLRQSPPFTGSQSGGKLTLDASSLKPMRQSPPFAGFQSGDTVILGIGYSVVEARTLKFSVIWVGMAKVK